MSKRRLEKKYALYYGARMLQRCGQLRLLPAMGGLSRQALKKIGRRMEGTGLQLLELHSPGGLDQCVHPDVVQMDDGSCLMAVTPYPFGLDDFECPVIYRSTDLEHWQRMAGPIDHQQSGKRNHLSDPTLVVIPDEGMRCYYRECIYDCAEPMTNIYAMRSADGQIWGEKECICSYPMQQYDVISPSLKWTEDRGLHGYFCLKGDGRMRLMYTPDGKLDGENLREICLDGCLPEGKILWHVSHICHGNRDVLLLTLAEDFGGSNSRLYMGLVERDSLTLCGVQKLGIRERFGEIAVEYRSSGLIRGDHLTVIASVQFENRMWGCIKFGTDLSEARG